MLYYLRRARTRPEFSSPTEELDVVKLFLSHGADPNVPAHLLAWAVNFGSLDVCRELLLHGADPNSAFPHTEFSPDQHGGRETALHCAIRRNSPNKVKMLLENIIQCDTQVTWRDMTILDFALHNSCCDDIMDMLKKSAKDNQCITAVTCPNALRAPRFHRISSKLRLTPKTSAALANAERTSQNWVLKKTKASKITRTIRRGISRMADHQSEIRALETALQDFLQAISDNLPEQFSHFRFSPILCGSMAEGTKCYQPDEFDFICKITSDAIVGKLPKRSKEIKVYHVYSYDARFDNIKDRDGCIEVVKFAATFYAAIDTTIKYLHSVRTFGNLEMCPNSLLLHDKISRLQLQWNGEFFHHMDVYVDLVPAVEADYQLKSPLPIGVKHCEAFLIPKVFRFDETHRHRNFEISHSSTEQAVIAALPLNVKQGLILAKAARIASIARPAEDLTSHYALQEDIHVDDFITSYLLKTCLLKLLIEYRELKKDDLERNAFLQREDEIIARLENDTNGDGSSVDTNDGSDSTDTLDDGLTWDSETGRLTNVEDDDSACGWAIDIYRKLKSDFDTTKVQSWHDEYGTLKNCSKCRVERGCCKKRKLTLAMTSQILDWLKRHKAELNDIFRVEQRTMVYSRQQTPPERRNEETARHDSKRAATRDLKCSSNGES